MIKRKGEVICFPAETALFLLLVIGISGLELMLHASPPKQDITVTSKQVEF